jgi:signal transduction histidine kinase
MSADDANHVFEAFYRSPEVRGVAGTGLGLSIVKRVVDARRGTVAIESRLGHGTTFIVRLPLAKPGAPEASGQALVTLGAHDVVQ